MGRQWPASVVNALRCLSALVGLMALGTLLTIVFQDALIESWAEGNPGASEILREGGIEALKASSIALPAFVPVVVVMFIVLLGLLAVLRVFLREGYEWARLSLAAVALLIGLAAGLIAFRESPPLVFVVSASSRWWSTSPSSPARPPRHHGVHPRLLAGHHDVPGRRRRSEPSVHQSRLALLTRCRAVRGTVLVVEHVFDSIRRGRPRPRSPPGRSGVEEPVKVARDASVRRPRGGPQGPRGEPEQFLWRGKLWKVRAVLAHWVETGSWWQSADARAVLGTDRHRHIAWSRKAR
jgi:hypothetical protein